MGKSGRGWVENLTTRQKIQNVFAKISIISKNY
jgi:hypothetical protein